MSNFVFHFTQYLVNNIPRCHRNAVSSTILQPQGNIDDPFLKTKSFEMPK
jgi:hypothetical protein